MKLINPVLRLATSRQINALVLVLIVFGAGSLALQAQITRSANLPGNRQKIRISDRVIAGEALAQGADLIADYGGFQVIRASDSLAAALSSKDGVENVNEQNVIELNVGPLDTTRPEIMALRKPIDSSGGPRLHLVQFAGPVKPEWQAALEQTGVRIVTYIPNNAYLVYGSPAALNQMQTWAASLPHVQWEGDYQDAYKINPRVGTAGTLDTFAIQLVADPVANADTLQAIDEYKLEPIRQQFEFIGYVNVVVRMPVDRLADIAAHGEVLSIQVFDEPHKFDERQDQILAKNLTGNSPSGPGYLAWLTGKGFSQAQFAASGFVVDLTDSGIDNGTSAPGHFGLYPGGDTNLPSRIAYNRLEGIGHTGSTLQGCDGHGTLNSHIICGFNTQSNGFPHQDAAGYRYGLGVCPFVRVGSSVIFDPDTFTSPNIPNLQSDASHDGAKLSSNSWGSSSAGAYNINSQTYDALVRDAQPNGSTFPVAGNQEMVIIFAAGNDGSGATTVGAPGTAKNVITVGAAENVRSMTTANGGNSAVGNDGCGTSDTGANSANDMISFSSRGPCTDGRKKPDIAAPGTHVSGGVAQNSPPPSASSTGSAIACFKGTGVCALPGGGTVGNVNNFFPLSQQFYTESSGTSHSCPAIAGCCALLRQYFINTGLSVPSPAMSKGFLMNSARYMNGVGANDTLWSNSQGMGEADLSMAFDGAPRVLRDELTVDKFTATGQVRTYAGIVSDVSKPFRVTIAWTDSPGNTAGNSYNNDLDLTVSVGGSTYKGNVFTGRNSATGGTADAKDNVESVFLPAGVTGPYVVTITAANIVSDGVPNQSPSLDQDFALVIYNATETAIVSPVAAQVALEGCTPTNGVADPNESLTMLFSLQALGNSNTTSLVATLLTTNGVTAPSAPQNYGALIAGGAPGTQAFTFTATGGCGAAVSPMLHLQDGPADLGFVSFSMQLGLLTPVLSENFDGVTAPALPAGWATATSGAELLWTTTTGLRDTVPNAAYSTNAWAAGVNELDSPPAFVASGGARLTFRHNYVTESGFDGGVLEIQIGAGPYTDILAAGGSFISGGYNGTITAATDNPLTGRAGWTGNSGGFISAVVALPPAAVGQTVQFRWRLGSDGSQGAPGWYIDTVALSVPVCCSPAPFVRPLLISPAITTNGLFSLVVSGSAGFNYVIEGTTNLQDWSAVGSVSNENGLVPFVETNALDPLRAYRARIVP